MTKANRQIVDSYNNSRYYDISQCYDNYSISKLTAQNDIINEMLSINGYGYKVLSFNTFMFTCAYKYEKDNKEFMVYHTPTRKVIIEL